MVSECSSLSTGIPAFVVVGLGVSSVTGLPFGSGEILVSVVQIRHGDQIAVEDFSDPQD
jgi:hypothetical protein